jgi:hypothetical protein
MPSLEDNTTQVGAHADNRHIIPTYPSWLVDPSNRPFVRPFNQMGPRLGFEIHFLSEETSSQTDEIELIRSIRSTNV